MHQQQTAFENIRGREEIARKDQFLLFPTMFSTQSDNCTTKNAYIVLLSCIFELTFLDWLKLRAFADDKINLTKH